MSSATIVARNSIYGLLALGIDKGVFMVIVLALARHLGTADFGRYAFVMTYVAVLQIVTEAGLEMVLVRRVSQEPKQRDRLLANGLAMRLLSGTVAWAVAVACVPLIADTGYVGVTLLAGSCLVWNAWTAYKILYRSLLRIEYLLLLITFNALATGLGVLVVIMTRRQLTAAVAASAVGSAASLPFAVWLGWRYFRVRLRCEPQLWRAIIREALPLGLNAFLVSMLLRIGPLLLVRLRGPEEVAYFSAASKLVEAFLFLPEVPMLTVFPMMAALRREQTGRLANLTRIVTKWIVVLLLPVVLAVGGLSDSLLRLLYGQRFASAESVLVILVWATGFAATGAVWIGVLTTLGQQRSLLRLYGVATAVNVALAWALIPPLGGVGAALAALTAAAVSQALLVWLPATAAYIRPAAIAVIPAFLIAGALAVTARLLPVPPLAGTAVALAVYAFAVVATGVIGPQERAFARRLFGRAITTPGA